MKGKFALLLLIFAFLEQMMSSQVKPEAEVYLITCGPGTETYSVYGHSALRIVIPSKNSDIVYNWGIFDFSTPHFAWEFAKGRLDYMLGDTSYDSFLKEYYAEHRWVISQKFNIESKDIENLFVLVADNLKPENIKYKYDFYYDNCSTRIRDLVEKAIGEDLIYPPEESKKEMLTFRNLTGDYEKGYPWTKFGIDLLIGSPGDKKATFRDRMFLPVGLKEGLSALNIRRNGKMIPLLTNPEIALDFDRPVLKEKLLSSPLFIFSLLLIIVIIISGLIRGKKGNTAIDICLFLGFSALAILMIFSNFFTDHQQLRWNLNIIWLNPFILVCLASILFGKNWNIWFRITFFLAAGFLLFIVILPQQINNAFVPLIIMLLLRSSIRAGFKWNPLKLTYLTEL
jgi:hypothetical protein